MLQLIGPTNQFSLARKTAQIAGIDLCVYTPVAHTHLRYFCLSVQFQPGVSVGRSERSFVSISSWSLVTVSFLPVSVFGPFVRMFLHVDSPFCSTRLRFLPAF